MMNTRRRVVAVLCLGVFLGLLFSAIGANAQTFFNDTGSYAQPARPYHYYHHYQYDSYPYGTPQPKDYTYDPYPYYRGYTYTHPPYYGFSGTRTSRNPFGEQWGLFVTSDRWHYR